MNTFQMIMVGIAAVFVWTQVPEISDPIKKLFNKKPKPKPPVDKSAKPVKPINNYPEREKDMSNTISDIVEQWEMLKAKCEAAGLDASVEKLNEVFPTFISVSKEKKEVNNEQDD